MSAEFKIPPGYRLVPEDLYQSVFTRLNWPDIDQPTISQVAKYLGITTHKIRKDVLLDECPLKVLYEGKPGRGNDRTFIKESVEDYKKWLNKKGLRQQPLINS